MPALFKRKSKDAEQPDVDDTPVSAVTDERDKRTRDKSGPTPRQQVAPKKRPPKRPPMTYKEQREQAKTTAGPKPDKDTKRALAAERRAERERIAEGQDRGDPMFDQYHMPRDKGPERLLVRDIVDSRRNVGQYFFLIAIIIMLASSMQSVAVQQISLIGWVLILVAFAIDSVLLSRRVLRTVRERFPKSTQGKAGLSWYAISRSIMFRKLRMPRPRPGMVPGVDKSELGKVRRAGR